MGKWHSGRVKVLHILLPTNHRSVGSVLAIRVGFAPREEETTFPAHPSHNAKGKNTPQHWNLNCECRSISCALKSGNYSIHSHFYSAPQREGLGGWVQRSFSVWHFLRQLPDRRTLNLMWKICAFCAFKPHLQDNISWRNGSLECCSCSRV